MGNPVALAVAFVVVVVLLVLVKTFVDRVVPPLVASVFRVSRVNSFAAYYLRTRTFNTLAKPVILILASPARATRCRARITASATLSVRSSLGRDQTGQSQDC